jgi:drug/metabolite transporter (DMT)-like permease
VPPFATLVACWLINAFWPLVGQDGLRYFSTPVFFHLGLIIALAVLSPWVVRGGGWRPLLAWRTGSTLLLIGALSCTASLIYLEALRYTTAANAAVMAQIEVLYSAGLAAWLLRERIGPRQAAASLLVVAGTALIMGHDLGSLRWKGDLMILATPWMYQLSHVFIKRLPEDLSPVQLVGGRMFYGIIFLLPFTLWHLTGEPRWSWSRPALGILALQGVCMTALGMLSWYATIRRMDLAKATAFLLSYPALTMLFSWTLGRESISGVQVLGLAVTLGGAYWLSRLALRPRPKAPEPAPVFS